MRQQSLRIRLHGIHCADLARSEADGQLSIQYTREWLARSNAVPLSVRLPLRERAYGDDHAVPFVAGLLPDSKLHRRLIAQAVDLDASAPSDFSLLERIGRECAGAVSIVGAHEPDEPELSVVPRFEVMEEAALAAMIRELPQRPLMIGDDDVRLSLAGVNDKAAVIQVKGGVAMPHRGTPSTHILKVDIPRLPDSIRTEHFTLRLAAEMGIPTPRSRIGVAEDQVYMLISRYDRKFVQHEDGARVRRLHQEDFAQALGHEPDMKYERDGGPSWKDMFSLLGGLEESTQARKRMLDMAIFHWLVDNPDAHAKNFSLVHDAGRTALAPCYDTNCAYAFRDCFKHVRPRLAMSIGGVFDPNALTGDGWDEFAEDCGFAPNAVRAKIKTMANRMPYIAKRLEISMRDTPAWSNRLDQVVDIVSRRAASVDDVLERRAGNAVEEPTATTEETSIFSFP